MRIVCISDTHGIHNRMSHAIPDGDVLVHAGDITKNGRIEDLPAVESFFQSQPHELKLFTPGNHDWIFESDPELAKSEIPSAVCLIDEGFTFKNVNFWGTPWQPEFHDWAFNLPRGEALAEKWDLIPDDTDVLISHSPPEGILDLCSHGGREGCPDLLDRVREVEPSLHVFGHIHEAHGREQHGETLFINASICNLGYRPVNEPFVWDLTRNAS